MDPLTAEEILAGLADDEMLVSFVWTDDAVFALSAGGGEVSSHTMADGDEAEEELRAAFGRLRTALASQAGGPVEQGLLDELRAALLPEDLMARIGGAARVIVVPDGPLHAVPMEVLLPDTPICYAPSATIYLGRVRIARDREDAGQASVLVLGDPDFGAKAIDQEQVLASVRGSDFEAVEAGASALEQVRPTRAAVSSVASTKLAKLCPN